MKRILLGVLFAVALAAACVWAAAPEKPYPDLADGDTLSATWLMGTFNVLYNWCQVASGTITNHVNSTTGVHGAAPGSRVVTASEPQTLTNKTLASPTISGGVLSIGTGTIILPFGTTPAQTAEGSLVWDSDDDLLTAGTGAARKTMADTNSTQTLSGKTLATPTINAPTVNGGTHNLGTGTVVLPFGTSPAQTAEGSVFWDSDDDLLTIGTGSARVTMVDLTKAQTLSNKTIGSSNSIAGEAINSGIVADARIAATICRDSELDAHNASNSAHGCSSVASAAALNSHAASNATHGCASIASAAALADHAASNSTHGCTNVASAAALAAHTEASTGVHGMAVGEKAVGASSSQTLTNKTMGSGCVWNGEVISEEYLELGGTGAYDVAGFIPGTIPDGNANCFVFVAPRTVTFPSSLVDSRARALTAADAETVFSIWKNTTSVATLTFSASSATGTFTMTATQTLAAGDLWKITGPASGDVNLADISFTFKGSY